MGWRDEIKEAINSGALNDDPVKQMGALAVLSALELPTPDRIALARELLVGTGRVVARDVGIRSLLRPRELGEWGETHDRGWNACRAAMLADEGKTDE